MVIRIVVIRINDFSGGSKMKKLSVFTGLLVFVLAVTVFAYPGKHKYHKWWENEEYATKVGLSEKQIADLNAIDESYSEKFNTLRGELKALRVEMYDLMGDPKATDEAITAKHKEKTAKKTEKMELKLEKKLKMRATLSDEQIVTLAGIFKEKMAAYKQGSECSHKDGKECSYKHKKEGCSYKDK